LITLYHNNTCSKSLCALSVLEEHGQPYKIINYLETPPAATELREILERLGIEAIDLIRKGEPIYKTVYEGKNLTNEEWIAVMLEHPILIERPIIISDRGAVIARPPEKIYEVLG
jgi:arsenate reductase